MSNCPYETPRPALAQRHSGYVARTAHRGARATQAVATRARTGVFRLVTSSVNAGDGGKKSALQNEMGACLIFYDRGSLERGTRGARAATDAVSALVLFPVVRCLP